MPKNFSSRREAQKAFSALQRSLRGLSQDEALKRMNKRLEELDMVLIAITKGPAQ